MLRGKEEEKTIYLPFFLNKFDGKYPGEINEYIVDQTSEEDNFYRNDFVEQIKNLNTTPEGRVVFVDIINNLIKNKIIYESDLPRLVYGIITEKIISISEPKPHLSEIITMMLKQKL